MVDAFLDRISGLVVTGGAFDVPPEAYGEAPREGLGTLKPARTRFETALLQAALRRNMPVLGVCGGMQLLNVVLGGTLFQDIQRDLPEARNHEQAHDRGQPSHPVEVREGTLLAELVGRGQLMVNSTHHQAVSRLGEGLVASAVAPDGVVEGIESSNGAFAVGCSGTRNSCSSRCPCSSGSTGAGHPCPRHAALSKDGWRPAPLRRRPLVRGLSKDGWRPAPLRRRPPGAGG
jgi:putative glutamine amidotransferase